MEAQALEKIRMASWARRRQWSKTDTARWVTDRADAVKLCVKNCPKSRDLGALFRAKKLPIFERLHRRLSVMESDMNREQVTVMEVLR